MRADRLMIASKSLRNHGSDDCSRGARCNLYQFVRSQGQLISWPPKRWVPACCAVQCGAKSYYRSYRFE